MAKNLKFDIFLCNNFEFIDNGEVVMGVWVSLKIGKGIKIVDKKKVDFSKFLWVNPCDFFQKLVFIFFLENYRLFKYTLNL